MTLILMLSMAATFSASTTPVAAGSQKWSQITVPGDKMQLLPDSDISTIAVTPDGKTLFAGVITNESNESTAAWELVKSTDGGYTWKVASGYSNISGHNTTGEQIVAIKFSPDWANDGKMYVATSDTHEDGYVYMSKDSGRTWKDTGDPTGYYFYPITSMDVTLDSEGAVTVVVGDWYDAYLYSDGAWTPQNAGGWVQAVAFSPNYATDGTIVAVVNDGTHTLLRAETDIDANNWGNYMLDGYFSDKDHNPILAATACIAFPSDYADTSTVFVGLNTENSSTPVGLGQSPTGQKGDVFKVSFVSGVSSTSTVTDLNVRGTGTGTDVWSLAVSGDTSTANIVCGTRYASQSAGVENWQAQIYTSQNGGDSWSISIKPASGMSMDTADIGLCAPVVVMAPDFATSNTVYCANGYYSGTGGIALSGVYVSTDGGAIWNGRGLLDHTLEAITDIAPSSDYDNDHTIYMVTQDTHVQDMGFTLYIGLLWKTQDGEDSNPKWDLICNMIPLSPLAALKPAVDIDKVAITGDDVFITGSSPVLTVFPGSTAIYRSADNGASFPTSLSGRGPVDHLLAIDQNTLITANGSNIWLTVNGGGKWIATGAKGTESDILPTENVSDIAISGNTVIAGTDQGNVYICDDYTTDFSFYQVGSKSVGNSATSGTVVVAFDNNYATDHTVYAGVTGSNSGIWRNVDDSNTWDQLAFNVSQSANYSAVNSNVSAIACDNNGILWAICTATNDSLDTKGIPVRSVNPTESTLSKVAFDAPTTGLTDTLSGNLNVVGSTETFAVGGALDNELWIYTDTLVKVTLVSPANSATAAGDLLQGTSFARVVLTWTYLANADSYQYQVALDSNFNNIVTDSLGAFVNGTTPGTSLDVQLYAGTKYYWRVRVATGINSQWSDVWSFTTPLGPSAQAPVILSPTGGQGNVSLTPVLQWSGLAYSTQYELQVAKNCDFSGSNLIVDKTGSNALGDVTAYQLTGLTNGTNYCWKVRALGTGTNSAWSNTGSFTTAQETVPAAAESTPVWVWVIIALSAVLLVSVVILIIRTRRA